METFVTSGVVAGEGGTCGEVSLTARAVAAGLLARKEERSDGCVGDWDRGLVPQGILLVRAMGARENAEKRRERERKPVVEPKKILGWNA